MEDNTIKQGDLVDLMNGKGHKDGYFYRVQLIEGSSVTLRRFTFKQDERGIIIKSELNFVSLVHSNNPQ